MSEVATQILATFETLPPAEQHICCDGSVAPWRRIAVVCFGRRRTIGRRGFIVSETRCWGAAKWRLQFEVMFGSSILEWSRRFGPVWFLAFQLMTKTIVFSSPFI